MELKDFIGKIVVSPETKKRYKLYNITSPEIGVHTLEADSDGHYTFYSYPTINGDPFEKGYLTFEDASLNEQFKKIYDAYCRTTDAYWEEYGYWMRRD